MRALFIIFISLYFHSAASASSLAEMRTALYEGHFESAYAQAQALGTEDGLVLAAEALNAKLLLGGGDKPSKTAKTSMRLAKQALTLNARNADAQMQYAIAYGFYGRHVSPFKAWRKKIPLKILAEIQKAATMQTNTTRQSTRHYHALQGAWHFSVVNRAGAKRAQKFYGANEVEGQKYFEMALRSHPNDILISANYTVMRYVLAPETHEIWARERLRTLSLIPSQNAVEARVQVRMKAILDAFDAPTNASSSALILAQEFLT